MEPFVRLTAATAPLDRANVDTDQIIPKQFLKRIERTGFGEFLFHDWRQSEDDFVLARPEFRHAPIVQTIAHALGISTETAAWMFEIVNSGILIFVILFFLARVVPKAIRNRTANIQKKLVEARQATELVDYHFRRRAVMSRFDVTPGLPAVLVSCVKLKAPALSTVMAPLLVAEPTTRLPAPAFSALSTVDNQSGSTWPTGSPNTLGLN